MFKLLVATTVKHSFDKKPPMISFILFNTDKKGTIVEWFHYITGVYCSKCLVKTNTREKLNFNKNT